MRAIIVSALAAMGLLAFSPNHADASWLSKALRGCREPRCQPVPQVSCQPPVQPPCGYGGCQGAQRGYYGYEQRQIFIPTPPPTCQRPCGEVGASFRLEIRIPGLQIEDCYTPPPPCRRPVRSCQPCW